MANQSGEAQEPSSRRRLFGVPAVGGLVRAPRSTKGSAAGGGADGNEQAGATPARGSATATPARRSATSTPSAATDPGVVAAGVPEDVARILAALTTPALWVLSNGSVLWAHPSLEALRVVRRGAINSQEITRMVQRCITSDEPAGRDVTIRRPGRRSSGVRLRVRVAPMADSAALVLIQDITEAERLDNARRDFVANVSHELKTPIGALALLAEAVHHAEGEPEALERFTARMQVETRRLTTLVNDLMDLSRLEGVAPLEPMGPVQVDEVVAQACDDARSLAQDKDITFLRGGVPGLLVEGVPEQLATAVRNLIVNAINYSPPATKVAVTTGTSGSFVTISVTDQGIGIPAAELDRIFERFYRVDAARSRVTGGTGLGLSIVKHVSANHGGDCEVWSKVGEGSTFTIRLPGLKPAKAARRNSTRTSGKDAGPPDMDASTPKEEQ